MTTTMKTFVAFVLTVFFIMSSAHCRTTTGGSPGYGIGGRTKTCFTPALCIYRGVHGCDSYCKTKNFDYGYCRQEHCCCVNY
ncbi:putative defensin-like protein 102 [Arabidopsis thaliana]|uniref:Putative defensin-like protein 102 n=4 Tax=Arabidopsis TaxID=3701 RepID=DF102_ARATH|nr:Molecular chaperone Hsp40/DnaJ family protein [Arabidopsis thaliana]Q2V3L0.1 RecName: Full=Putative defensin-like protein 102; Flags: Precursor [Arabidopsis thaliana]KAG7615260.1 hypothetical protein ISN45_At04g007910 [Arabidopsis thaliana x Arabidopsis arenosa]KAG7619744.1 hypothetical protein ISN44_As04g007350 [Arabidopsis suecica]AEE82591.1 Molecular chaperone Hsp40/DnaJ family protein [Arabidopsis thaliana]CAA0394028.1 unnamed protein product [Arabidopsis thaliana]|eukprot:NP_001031591.1 Molecular chaperone Hsp40/DnaJ family protein [Arabidopsis thaliana]